MVTSANLHRRSTVRSSPTWYRRRGPRTLGDHRQRAEPRSRPGNRSRSPVAWRGARTLRRFRTWQVTLDGNVVDTATGASYNFAPQQPASTASHSPPPTQRPALQARLSLDRSAAVIGLIECRHSGRKPTVSDGILEPSRKNKGLDSVTPVTFSNLAGSPTITYFTGFDQQAGMASGSTTARKSRPS